MYEISFKNVFSFYEINVVFLEKDIPNTQNSRERKESGKSWVIHFIKKSLKNII